MLLPPPNVTGALHLGHAINNTLQDVLTRVHRMRGFNAVWIPGIDHAGIATQAVVERQLKEKENKTRHDVGREELVRRIWQWKEQYEKRILGQLRELGCSCDWQRTRFTLDPMCARAVRQTFFQMFKDGLISKSDFDSRSSMVAPFGQCRIAFSTKFANICVSRLLSPLIVTFCCRSARIL